MKTIKRVLIILLIFIILILFLSFTYIDIVNKCTTFYLPICNILKYLSICLCFALSLLIGKDCISSFDKRLLQLGLLFTTFADLCLLILDQFTIGVSIFCIVQICYIVRFNKNLYYPYLRNLLFILFCIISITIILKNFNITIEALYTVSIFYAFCLITAVLSSIGTKKNKLYGTSNIYLIIIGMVLFMLCDINVALYNITNENLGLSWINTLSSHLIWIFYLPSQLLLSLSGFNFFKGNYFH